MPIGKITAESAKKGAVELVKQLVSLAISEAIKRIYSGIAKTAAGSAARQSARVRWEQKQKNLSAKVDKHGDEPLTGLSFSLAVAQVFVIASEFPAMHPDDLIDVLMGIVDNIDLAVDSAYRSYRRRVKKDLGVAGEALDHTVNAVGVPEIWHTTVNWTPIYRRLKKTLRTRLEQAATARKQALAQVAANKVSLRQTAAAVKLAKKKLRQDIVTFVRHHYGHEWIEDHAVRDSCKALKVHRRQLRQARGATKQVNEKGVAAYNREVYQKEDLGKLQRAIKALEDNIRQDRTRLSGARSDIRTKKHQCRRMEKKLYEDLRRIRKLHWEHWKAKEALGMAEGVEPLPDLGGLPPLDVPWRRSNSDVAFNECEYPFNVNED